MNWDKTFEAVEDILQNVSEEDFKEILKRVKSMNIRGKSFKEYLDNFESEYNNSIYTNIPTTQNDKYNTIDKRTLGMRIQRRAEEFGLDKK